MTEGVRMIEKERMRQIQEEGWSARHDDRQHRKGELACAAVWYALNDDQRDFISGGGSCTDGYWPFDEEWWKPTPDDRIRELVKSGALIAAEIDRLLRQKG